MPLDPLDEQDLEKLFANARRTAPLPGPDLLERIAADADAMQPRLVPPMPQPVPQPIPIWERMLSRVIGPAGLVTAGLLGVWIGTSDNLAVNSYATAALDTEVGLQLAYHFPQLAAYVEGGYLP